MIIMPQRRKLPHTGQILTTRATILDYINSIEKSVIKGLLYCVTAAGKNEKYNIILYSICSKLWFLSKMVYKSNRGIVKLSFKEYKKYLFDRYIKNEQDIIFWLKNMNLKQVNLSCERRCIDLIILLWCQMISCNIEQVFISELGYALDYVMSRRGNIEFPSFTEYSLFPQNYNDFKYWEGIAEYFEKLDNE